MSELSFEPKTENKLITDLSSNTRIKVFKEKYYDIILDFVQSIVVAIIICLVIYVWIAMPNQIEGDSMLPNFHNDEIILTLKLPTWLNNTSIGDQLGISYSRGDVIVFQKPGNSDYIKRVIGMPGDTININDGKVYINGIVLEESYIPDYVNTGGSGFIRTGDLPKTIPDGHYFVMGDNRGNSHDSRSIDIGFIKEDWIKGKVILRYWPVNSFKVFAGEDYNK